MGRKETFRSDVGRCLAVRLLLLLLCEYKKERIEDMENEKPLILVSNDDGVMAKGINELVKFLRPLGDIVVMAPDAPRSGSGCALTVTQPVHYQLVKKEVGLTVYKCSGTPTDCIKLARNTVLDRTPDLVVGGINHGDNSATNVHYSGTMGVVFEGCLNGIPSIGFSLCNHAPDADLKLPDLIFAVLPPWYWKRTSSFNLSERKLPGYDRYQRNQNL